MTTSSGNKWAVVIGINDYHESLGSLKFCANDAKLMQQTLVSECCGFPPEKVVLLTEDQAKDRQPTVGNIHSWLGTWLSRPKPEDTVLVYFAGHGRELNGQALLAPVDVTLESLPVAGIPVQHIRELLERCRARQKILILDACHSGAGRDVATMTADFREALDAGEGLYTVASCDVDQISYEWPEKKHGLFTYYLAEAINTAVEPDSSGNVTLDAVYDWVRQKVSDWSAGRRVRQDPIRFCRTKGVAAVGKRPLTTGQMLEQARVEVRSLEGVVEKLRSKVEELKDENEELRASRTDKKESDRSRVRAKVTPYEAWLKAHEKSESFTDGRRMWVGAVISTGYVFGILPGLVLHLVFLRGRRNRYRLYCAEECLNEGDYVQGSGFVTAVGKICVDKSKAGNVATGLGDLARDHDEVALATEICRCACNRWRSPRARVALEEMGRVV